MKFERIDAQPMTAERFADKFGEYPVDKNDPEAAMTAIYYSVPTGFSPKAKAVMDYLDDTAWIFEYKDQLIVTDESLYLTSHGDGTSEAPLGGPRFVCDSWEELEELLELTYQDLVENEVIAPIKLWPEGTTRWSYGMRLRGFSIGCQPKEGFVERTDDPDGKYWDIIVYDRPLTDTELDAYDLDFIDGRVA